MLNELRLLIFLLSFIRWCGKYCQKFVGNLFNYLHDIGFNYVIDDENLASIVFNSFILNLCMIGYK